MMRVGQVVLYVPPRGMQYFNRELAAIVTEVHADKRVNLAVFDPGGFVIQRPHTHVAVEGVHAESGTGVCRPLKDVPPFFDVPYVPHPEGGPNITAQLPFVCKSCGSPRTTRDRCSCGGDEVLPPGVGELPPGAVVEETRPATPEEVAAAKAALRKPSVVEDLRKERLKKNG